MRWSDGGGGGGSECEVEGKRCRGALGNGLGIGGGEGFGGVAQEEEGVCLPYRRDVSNTYWYIVRMGTLGWERPGVCWSI